MLHDEPVDILVIEENKSESASIVSILQQTIPGVHILAVHDSEEALEFLSTCGDCNNQDVVNFPKLFLLDFSVTGVDNFSLLKKIRALEQKENPLICTPVIIFSDLQICNDITESYHYGANSFIVKPQDVNEFNADLTAAVQYWLTAREHISNES